jgi:hypothetical protein
METLFRTHARLATVLLGMLLNFMSTGAARALDTVSCATVLNEVEGSAFMTGVILGKAPKEAHAVQQFTTPNFDPNTWRPAVQTVPAITPVNNVDHFRAEVQAVQTFVGNQAGFSGSFDLWFYKSGTFYSRALTWNGPWSRWEDVKCYRAAGATPRFIATGFIPDGGWFVSIDMWQAKAPI